MQMKIVLYFYIHPEKEAFPEALMQIADLLQWRIYEEQFQTSSQSKRSNFMGFWGNLAKYRIGTPPPPIRDWCPGNLWLVPDIFQNFASARYDYILDMFAGW